MSATGKYLAMAVRTSEERESHRALVKEVLKKIDISQEFRRELEVECKRAAQNVKEEDKNKKRKKSSSGGLAGAGTQGGSGGDLAHGKESDKFPEEKETDASGPQIIEMLFFQAERSLGIAQPIDITILKAPVAAETLLFNRDNGVAQIHVPFWIARGSLSTARGVFLPLLEQHAALIGARQLHVPVHAEVAAAFQKEYGYLPYGEIAVRNGTPIQQMVKNLIQSALPKNDII